MSDTARKCPPPGIYEGIPFSEYVRWEAVNASFLKKLLISPIEAANYLDFPDEPTPATILGSAVHAAVGEPETLDKFFCCAGQCQIVKKDGLQCENPGKIFSGIWYCGVHGKSIAKTDPRTVLSPLAWATMLNMAEAVKRHPATSLILKAAKRRELSIVWNCKRTGLLCKGRIDFDSTESDWRSIDDLKTTRHSDPAEFKRDAFCKGYLLQLAHYADGAAALGMTADRYGIIAVTSDEHPKRPDVVHYFLDSDALEVGRAQLITTIDVMAALPKDRSKWRGVSDEFVSLSVEPFMKRAVGMSNY